MACRFNSLVSFSIKNRIFEQNNKFLMKTIIKTLLFFFIVLAFNQVSAIQDTSVMKKAHIWVKNSGATPITLIVERTESFISNGQVYYDSVPGSSVNYFCWGSCYPPSVSISTDLITIQPGAIDKISFEADYEIKGGAALVDTGQITYCFIDDCNANNTQCFTALYSLNSTADSIYQMLSFDTSWCTFSTAKSISPISKTATITVHPNPAKEFVKLEYSLNLEEGERCQFVLRNVLGAEVINIDLRGANGKITIPISKLNRGIYFYSLVRNNNVSSTNKLIVD